MEKQHSSTPVESVVKKPGVLKRIFGSGKAKKVSEEHNSPEKLDESESDIEMVNYEHDGVQLTR